MNQKKIIILALAFSLVAHAPTRAAAGRTLTKCAIRARKRFCPCFISMENLNETIASHKEIRQQIRSLKQEMKQLKDPQKIHSMQNTINYWREAFELRNLDVLYHAGKLNEAAKKDPACVAFIKQRKIDL